MAKTTDTYYLTSAEKSLLSDLLKVRAATALSFEIETDRIGEADLPKMSDECPR
jgi:hypothetical protein